MGEVSNARTRLDFYNEIDVAEIGQITIVAAEDVKPFDVVGEVAVQVRFPAARDRFINELLGPSARKWFEEFNVRDRVGLVG